MPHECEFAYHLGWTSGYLNQLTADQFDWYQKRGIPPSDLINLKMLSDAVAEAFMREESVDWVARLNGKETS